MFQKISGLQGEVKMDRVMISETSATQPTYIHGDINQKHDPHQ